MKEISSLALRYPSKTAFITGAGSGLGAAFADIFIAHGWQLYLSDIRAESLTRYNDVDHVITFILDVGNLDQYRSVVEEVKKSTDRIDVLINNAGIGDGHLFEEYSLELWERMMRTNLYGTVYGTHLILPFMTEDLGGMIINIGSSACYINLPFMTAYNSSKAAVFSFSDTIRQELKKRNITVSVATPTFFRTDIMQFAEGPKDFIDYAKSEMSSRKVTPEHMASVILKQAIRGKFHINEPFEAKITYFIKRWFPGVIQWQVNKLIDVYYPKAKASSQSTQS